MPSAVAALNIGVGPCWGGVACGDMLEAMARITPSQPSDAMARIASRRNRTISLDPNPPGQISERFLGRRFKIVLEGPNRFEKGLGEDSAVKKDAPPVTHAISAILRSAYSGFCCIPPVVRRLLKLTQSPTRGTSLGPLVCGANNDVGRGKNVEVRGV